MALEERIEFGMARQMITADDDFKLVDNVHKLLKVDLACGRNKREGYIGVDREALNGVDIVHDLNVYPWPFDDESVYEFVVSHYVEHIPIMYSDRSYGLVKFMEEVYRCLMVGGLINIVAPYYTSIRAWQDPTHTRAITDVTFLYFCKDFKNSAGVDHYVGECNFELVSKKYYLNPEWESRSDEARNWAMKHYFNVIDDIEVVLRKRS